MDNHNLLVNVFTEKYLIKLKSENCNQKPDVPVEPFQKRKLLKLFSPGDNCMISIFVFGMMGRAQSPAQIQTVRMYPTLIAMEWPVLVAFTIMWWRSRAIRQILNRGLFKSEQLEENKELFVFLLSFRKCNKFKVMGSSSQTFL